MRHACLVSALGLAGSVAQAELANTHFVVGNQQVWIDVFEQSEIMWVGRNQYERTQVLSGPDIETIAVVGKPEEVALVGQRALVAEVPGTHSCDDLSDPKSYYVVVLGDTLATDGPLTTCGAMTVSLVAGAIVLAKDPVGEGEAWTWSPGEGWAVRTE